MRTKQIKGKLKARKSPVLKKNIESDKSMAEYSKEVSNALTSIMTNQCFDQSVNQSVDKIDSNNTFEDNNKDNMVEMAKTQTPTQKTKLDQNITAQQIINTESKTSLPSSSSQISINGNYYVYYPYFQNGFYTQYPYYLMPSNCLPVIPRQCPHCSMTSVPVLGPIQISLNPSAEQTKRMPEMSGSKMIPISESQITGI
jgi:hypothetical protein